MSSKKTKVMDVLLFGAFLPSLMGYGTFWFFFTMGVTKGFGPLFTIWYSMLVPGLSALMFFGFIQSYAEGKKQAKRVEPAQRKPS